MTDSQAIVQYQPLLQRIAYKMLGSMADAEDVVHDTFLRWLATGPEKAANTKAYLVRSLKNNCLNYIEAINKKKNEWLENIPTLAAPKIEVWELFPKDREIEFKKAIHILHQKLEPLEKGIFILREMFMFEYDELQMIFEKKAANCRQLFHRAKKKLEEQSWQKSSPKESQSFYQIVLKACSEGHLHELIFQLKKDIE